jgi:hypothetical protein
MPVDAATAAARWETGASGATGKWAEGIQSTQVDVAARAIQQQGVMAANFAQAVSSGRWARRLTESGGTANWKAQSLAKQSNYGTGVSAAKGKFQAAMQQLLPYIYAGKATIDSMPKGSIGASKARVNAWIDYMAAYKAR